MCLDAHHDVKADSAWQLLNVCGGADHNSKDDFTVAVTVGWMYSNCSCRVTMAGDFGGIWQVHQLDSRSRHEPAQPVL